MFAVGVFEGQPSKTALYGNVTYAADLSFYYDEIDAVVSLPEPAALPQIVGGVALLLAVGHRRIRR